MLRPIAAVLIAAALAGCIPDDNTTVVTTDTVALEAARVSRDRTLAQIACIELCVADGNACSNPPGDCNARCNAQLAGVPGICMALARDWYRCVIALFPFCVDGSAYRWGCYAEDSEYEDCLF